MRILYVCDRLITFILNEVIELQADNDVTLLAFYSEGVFNSILQPMMIRHGLEDKYHRYRSYYYPKKKERYIHFVRMLMHDILVHPVRTLKIMRFIFKNYQNPRYGFINYFDVRDMLDQKIDIIHSPFSSPNAIDKVYLLSEVLNVPFTLCFRAHDIYFRDNLAELQKRTNVIRKAAKVITIADYNRRYLRDKIDIDGDMEIVHSAINTDLFKPDKHILRSNKSILSVCRLEEDKGVIYLIEACHILNKRNIDYECTIIGEGPKNGDYEKRIHELIDELRVPNIRFISYMPYSEIKEHFNRATVFVLPSVIASQGNRDILANVLKEAMATELPVITSNMCGIEELVDDGINGILVSPKDPAAIADAVVKVFENPGLGREMGAEGRKKIAKDFNVKIESKKLGRIFGKIIEHEQTGAVSKEFLSSF